ncbi:MAG TPA: aminopeptidase [Candidatus Onthocola stercoravium]|nr:aminopeptidase [Candidatus Onthocola stercoravium]
MIEELENKYVNLIIDRCLSFKRGKSLFINYFDDNEKFVEKLVTKAKSKGIDDIYLDRHNKEERHQKLLQSVEEIKNDDYFDASIWDEYAKKDAAFLMLSTEFPGYFADIPSENMTAASLKTRTSKPIYKLKQLTNEISWCIAVIPNKIWAKEKFPDLSDEDAYNEYFKLMCHCTMVDRENPIEEWDKFLDRQRSLVKALNDLQITKMHYTNSLGTDLVIGLSPGALWQCAGYEGEDIIVNMPTYEVFTSPDYRLTEGIVYASKPLMYGGALVDKFWVKFKDGKVIDYDAEVGKEILKGIIESDEYSCFLGECALVDKNTAIAETNFVYGETCLDENASCHIALGDAFPECLKGAEEESIDERRDRGLNHSDNHVDFMIGTDDLNIVAETKDGEMLIFKNGKFNL